MAFRCYKLGSAHILFLYLILVAFFLHISGLHLMFLVVSSILIELAPHRSNLYLALHIVIESMFKYLEEEIYIQGN